jgi:cyclophilin family peptidyl-prolyl cis-trans isomerase
VRAAKQAARCLVGRAFEPDKPAVGLEGPTYVKEHPVKRVLVCLFPLVLAACSPSVPNPVVEIDTSMGKIKAELYQDKAPMTVKNFLRYVDDKHYDGTIFHRVIPDFMIQGGGFEPGMKERKETNMPIQNESDNGVTNDRGTLAMARTDAPNSATDQFFVNVKDNDFLNRAKAPDKVGYAVFGKVIEGMNVVDKIRNVPTQNVGGHESVPVDDVMIKSIRRIDAEKKDAK